MKAALLLAAALACAVPVSAQTAPTISLRPFAQVTEESFSAIDTFNGAFGRSYAPFWGGGLQATLWDRYYVELSASRFRKTGDRAFRSGGETFHFGIPLTATLTPFEITGGYRYHFSRRIVPYVGAGFGRYAYQEKCTSDAARPALCDAVSGDVDTRHAGFVLNGGAEFRLHRWIGLGADVQYTHVPGILGQDGLSKDAGENDLGGIAGRIKIIVGR
jgi:outer membrane protein W